MSELKRYECPKCKKIMITKSISMLRCNKCGFHTNIKNFKYIPREWEVNNNGS